MKFGIHFIFLAKTVSTCPRRGYPDHFYANQEEDPYVQQIQFEFEMSLLEN